MQTDEQKINSGLPHAGNLVLNATGPGVITYGPAIGKTTITGDVTITGNASGTINLQNIQVIGNIIVNTPNATVNNNSATATVDIIINEVKVNTWNENTSGNNIVFKSSGTTLKIASGVTVKNLILNAAKAKVTFIGTAKTTNPVEVKAAVTIISKQVVPAKVDDKVELTIKADESEEGITVTGDSSNGQVEINPADSTRVDNILKKITPEFVKSQVYSGAENEGIMKPIVEAIKGLLNEGESIRVDYSNNTEPTKDEDGNDLPYFPDLKRGEYQIILYINGAMGSKTIDVSEVKVDTAIGLQKAQKYNVSKIILTKDIETNEQILITKKDIIIDGNNKTITAASGMTYSEPNKSVLTILKANGVTISNLTIDATKVNTANKWDGIYAVQVYASAGVKLNNVTLQNSDAGLLVNGSEVTVDNITTLGNEFGGIEVSQGKEVMTNAKLTVTGTSRHNNDEVHIWTIGNNATVVDNNSQYKYGLDIRENKVEYVNFILQSESRPVPFTKEVILIEYLTTVKSYNGYGIATNWMDISNLSVVGKAITADFDYDGTEDGIKAIYNNLSPDENGEVEGTGGKKDAVLYAIDSYVMNTLARYLGALEYNTPGTVSKILFDGKEYTWQQKNGNNGGYLAASNWRDANLNTLVSAIVTQQETSIRNVMFTIVDGDNNSIIVTFEAVEVPAAVDVNIIR